VEVLCDVSFSLEKMEKIVNKTGGCFTWGGSVNLAPADDKIIRVESPISLDPVGGLIASILAKKKSVSATHVVIDIPVGKGCKTESRKRAYLLKRKFERIARRIDMKVKVVVTDGSEPIGNGIGPALEARDVLYTLMNSPKGSRDLREKSIALAGHLFELVGKAR
jgi:thymidine phosphorylase